MTNLNDLPLDSSWQQYLTEEFNKAYMQKLQSFLQQQAQQKKIIYPEENQYFHALNLTPFKQVKVVILGQDPYHGEGQAHGLSFSVLANTKYPPSLVNIYKELTGDLAIELPESGNFTSWAEQGVLLLNSVLTVEKNQAAAHQKQGWEQFTDKIIQSLNEYSEGIVFILWGAYAQKKASFIDDKKHFILKSSHPSPLSSYRGFFSSKPFSKTNAYLESIGKSAINW